MGLYKHCTRNKDNWGPKKNNKCTWIKDKHPPPAQKKSPPLQKKRKRERRGEIAKPTPGPWIFGTLFLKTLVFFQGENWKTPLPPPPSPPILWQDWCQVIAPQQRAAPARELGQGGLEANPARLFRAQTAWPFLGGLGYFGAR